MEELARGAGWGEWRGSVLGQGKAGQEGSIKQGEAGRLSGSQRGPGYSPLIWDGHQTGRTSLSNAEGRYPEPASQVRGLRLCGAQ